MKLQALKCLDDKPVMSRPRRKTENPAMNFLCNCVYGINYKKAGLIINQLHIRTLEDLLNLSMEDLVSVRGIGQATAEKILKQLKGGVIQ